MRVRSLLPIFRSFEDAHGGPPSTGPADPSRERWLAPSIEEEPRPFGRRRLTPPAQPRRRAPVEPCRHHGAPN